MQNIQLAEQKRLEIERENEEKRAEKARKRAAARDARRAAALDIEPDQNSNLDGKKMKGLKARAERKALTALLPRKQKKK